MCYLYVVLYEYRQRSSATTWLAEKYDCLSKVVENFTEVINGFSTDFNQTIHQVRTMDLQRNEEISNASESRLMKNIDSIRQTINLKWENRFFAKKLIIFQNEKSMKKNELVKTER